jgi:formyltetrahydrofolate deformylase
MQVVITAIGPDNRGLADPIIHHVTGLGANIAEIQMYDHDEEAVFAMLCRIELASAEFPGLKKALADVAQRTKLSIRVWSPEERAARPRLAIATTLRPEPAAALLQAIQSKVIPAEAVVMFGNRPACRALAEEHGVPWQDIGDANGNPNEDKLISICDEYEVDYLILARYMRILPAATCWRFAGGRIINLHHGLLPSFKGMRPYHDAYATRMLTYGATCHFIVPELDAGNQIIYQSTFTADHDDKLEDITRRGERENEPHCLVEGVRRVVAREVQLHFHRVISRAAHPAKG